MDEGDWVLIGWLSATKLSEQFISVERIGHPDELAAVRDFCKILEGLDDLRLSLNDYTADSLQARLRLLYGHYSRQGQHSELARDASASQWNKSEEETLVKIIINLTDASLDESKTINDVIEARGIGNATKFLSFLMGRWCYRRGHQLLPSWIGNSEISLLYLVEVMTVLAKTPQRPALPPQPPFLPHESRNKFQRFDSLSNSDNDDEDSSSYTVCDNDDDSSSDDRALRNGEQMNSDRYNEDRHDKTCEEEMDYDKQGHAAGGHGCERRSALRSWLCGLLGRS